MANVETQKKRKSRFFSGFVLGAIAGAVGVAVAPHWWQSYLPDALFPGGSVNGTVLEKSAESDRLLLKLETDEGVVLASFTERLEEIELLVEKGDRVTLRVSRYEPFLTDPRLDRVRKGEKDPAAPAVPPVSASPPRAEEAEEESLPTESTTTAPPDADQAAGGVSERAVAAKPR